jgi:hypothetical protein
MSAMEARNQKQTARSCGSDASACSALFDLLMEQIDAARKRSDAFEKQCREEENDIDEACKHARVSNVLWHIYHYGLHIAAHPPGCKICEFEEGWGKPFCESCGKIFLPNAGAMARGLAAQEPESTTEIDG